MSTAYSTTPEQPSRVESILLAPVAGLCWLMNLTLPRDERDGQR